MSSSTDRARAVVLALLMVGSVFGATIAFTGGAAADIQTNGTSASNVTAGGQATQTINVSGNTTTENTTDTFRINVSNITESGATITNDSIAVTSTDGETSVNGTGTNNLPQYNSTSGYITGNVTDGSDADSGNFSFTLSVDLDLSSVSPQQGIIYTISQYNNTSAQDTVDTQSVSFDVLDGESPTASQSTNDATDENATINVTLTDDVAVDESTINVSAVNQSGDETVIVENGQIVTGVNESSTLDDSDDATETINVSVDLPDGTYNLSVAANDTSDNRFNTTALGDNFTVTTTTTSNPTTLNATESSINPNSSPTSTKRSYDVTAVLENVTTNDGTVDGSANFTFADFDLSSASVTDTAVVSTGGNTNTSNAEVYDYANNSAGVPYVNVTWDDENGATYDTLEVSFTLDQTKSPATAGDYPINVTTDVNADGETEIVDATVDVINVSESSGTTGPSYTETTYHTPAGENATVNVTISDETAVNQSSINVNVTNTSSGNTTLLVENGNATANATVLDASTFNNSDDEQDEIVSVNVSLTNATYTIGASASDNDGNLTSDASVGNGFTVGPTPSSSASGDTITANTTEAGAVATFNASGQLNLTSSQDWQYLTFNATNATLSDVQASDITIYVQDVEYTDGLSGVKVENGNLSAMLSNSQSVGDTDNVTVVIDNVTLPTESGEYNTSLDLETTTQGDEFNTFSDTYNVTATAGTPPTFAESTNNVTDANATINVSVTDPDGNVSESTIDVDVTNTDTSTTTSLVTDGTATSNVTAVESASTFTNGTDESTEYVNVTADLPEGNYTISASASDTQDNANATDTVGDGFTVTNTTNDGPTTSVAGVDVTLNRTKLVADNQTVIKATAQLVDSNGNDVNESDVRITRNINNRTQANITRLKGFGQTNADGVATLTLKANTSGYQVTVTATEQVTGNANSDSASFGTIPTNPTYDSNSQVASYDDDNDGTISSSELQSAAQDFRGGSLDMGQLQSAAAAFAS